MGFYDKQKSWSRHLIQYWGAVDLPTARPTPPAGSSPRKRATKQKQTGVNGTSEQRAILEHSLDQSTLTTGARRRYASTRNRPANPSAKWWTTGKSASPMRRKSSPPAHKRTPSGTPR